MKQMLKNILLGILLVVVIFIALFIEGIIILFSIGEPGGYIKYPTLNAQMLVTALIVLPTTYGFAGLLKIKSMAEAIMSGLIWTSCITLLLILLGRVDNDLEVYFGRIGTYVLLISALAGPILYAGIRKSGKSES